jgi:Uma2 family endonuclease
MTLDEFLAKYEHDPVLEYAQGVVTEKMSPGWDHGILQLAVCNQINAVALPQKRAFAQPELRVTDREAEVSRIPDVSAYVWERIERDPEARTRGAFIPPDIAVEIMSPGQGRGTQLERCRWFVAHGSQVALLVDSNGRSVTEVRPHSFERTYSGDDVIDLGDIVPGVTLSVGTLFAELRRFE